MKYLVFKRKDWANRNNEHVPANWDYVRTLYAPSDTGAKQQVKQNDPEAVYMIVPDHHIFSGGIATNAKPVENPPPAPAGERATNP